MSPRVQRNEPPRDARGTEGGDRMKKKATKKKAKKK
jgi:hypothetical protein